MRKHYLDNLRSTVVLLVVLYHVVYMFNGVAVEGVAGPLPGGHLQDALQYILYPWFMVLLFLISGISARLALQNCSEKTFFRSRTRKLLVPSTLGLLTFHWIQGYFNMQLAGAFSQMGPLPRPVLFMIMCLSGTGVLWYIQMLWIFSGGLLLLRRLEKGRLEAVFARFPATPLWLAVLVLPVWAAAQVLNTPIIAVYRFGIYGFVFLLGYYLFSREDIIDTLTKFRWWFGAAALVSGAAYVICKYGENYAVAPCVNSPLAVLYLWAACLAILGFGKKHFDHTAPLLTWINRRSWGLYIFHYLPIAVCGCLLPGSGLPTAWIYLITLAAGLGGGYALNAVVSSIPILRWCVLGFRKPGKEVNHAQ